MNEQQLYGPSDWPTVTLVASRLARRHMKKLAADASPGAPATWWAEDIALGRTEVPPRALNPLVLLVAELVMTLMSAKCGGDYDRAAAWLQSRPLFRFRSARIRGAVRYLYRKRRYQYADLDLLNPDLLAEAVDEMARGETRASLMQLYPEAQRVIPGWQPEDPHVGGGM